MIGAVDEVDRADGADGMYPRTHARTHARSISSLHSAPASKATHCITLRGTGIRVTQNDRRFQTTLVLGWTGLVGVQRGRSLRKEGAKESKLHVCAFGLGLN